MDLHAVAVTEMCGSVLCAARVHYGPDGGVANRVLDVPICCMCAVLLETGCARVGGRGRTQYMLVP